MARAWPQPQPDPAKANTRDADTRTVLMQEYSDHGQWARHYSTVRMTLGTFFITAATGVITLRWDHPETGIAVVAAGIFAIGVALFMVFTGLTFAEMNHQRDIVDMYSCQLKLRDKPLNRLSVWKGTGLPVALVLSIAFGIYDLWWLMHPRPAPVKEVQVTGAATAGARNGTAR